MVGFCSWGIGVASLLTTFVGSRVVGVFTMPIPGPFVCSREGSQCEEGVNKGVRRGGLRRRLVRGWGRCSRVFGEWGCGLYVGRALCRTRRRERLRGGFGCWIHLHRRCSRICGQGL